MEITKKLYVFAGDYRQAKFFHKHNHPDKELVYVDSPQQLRGLRSITLYTFGTANERNQAIDILQIASALNINVIHK